MNKNLITINNPTSITSEFFKTLRTNIEFGVEENQNIIMITSSEPGDGKSFVSSNLAASFAQMGKKVLLVDLDLRKGQQHKIFKLKNGKGMANLLNRDVKNDDDLYEELIKTIQVTSIDDLFVIPSGTIINNPSELLMNGKLPKFLDYFRDKFDYVFVDAPPLTLVTDSAIIARYVDASVLVVSMNKTNAKALNEAVGILKKANIDILGIVANNVKLNTRTYKYKKYEYAESNKALDKIKKITRRK